MHLLRKVLIFILFISFQSFANNQWYSHPYVSLNYGMGSVKPNASLTYDVPDSSGAFIFNDASTAKSTNMLSLGAGFEIPVILKAMNLSWQVGLSYEQFNQVTVSGTSVQGFPGAYSNFAYNYRINSRQLLLENKLMMNFKSRFHPYVLLGLGQGMNGATDYTESTQDTSSDTPVLFSNGNSSGFTYHLGVGVDADIMTHLRVGLSYLYSNLGKVTLGSGTIDAGSPTPDPFPGGALSQAHLYDQSVMLSLTYYL